MPENETFGYGSFVNSSPTLTHESILQSLNRWFDFSDVGGKKLFYGLENFTGTEAEWNQVPLIFASRHPTYEQMKRIQAGEVETVLSELDGTLGGTITKSSVVTAGQPRLEALISFTDPGKESDYRAGKLSLSTGFFCDPGDDGKLNGKVRPNHVLLFRQDEQNQPRDYGAMLLNSQDLKEEIMTNTNQAGSGVQNAGRSISEKNRTQFASLLKGMQDFYNSLVGNDITIERENEKPPAAGANQKNDEENMVDTNELKNQVESAATVKKDADAILNAKEAEIASLKAERDAMNAKLLEVEQEKKEAAWTNEKKRLTPGSIHKPEDEAKLKDLFLNKPYEYLNTAKFAGIPETPREGIQNLPEIESVNSRAVDGMTVGFFNAKTKTYEGGLK